MGWGYFVSNCHDSCCYGQLIPSTYPNGSSGSHPAASHYHLSKQSGFVEVRKENKGGHRVSDVTMRAWDSQAFSVGLPLLWVPRENLEVYHPAGHSYLWLSLTLPPRGPTP